MIHRVPIDPHLKHRVSSVANDSYLLHRVPNITHASLRGALCGGHGKRRH